MNGDSIRFAGVLGFMGHIRPKCEPERALQNAGVPSSLQRSWKNFQGREWVMGLEGPKSRGGLSQEGTLSDLVPIHADYIGLGLLVRGSTKK